MILGSSTTPLLLDSRVGGAQLPSGDIRRHRVLVITIFKRGTKESRNGQSLQKMLVKYALSMDFTFLSTTIAANPQTVAFLSFKN